MKRRKSKKKAFLNVLFWLVIVVSLIVALLGYFNVIGYAPHKWEINFPRDDTDFEIKKMPTDLPDIELAKEDYFDNIRLYDEEKNCFFDIQCNCPWLLTVKIWTISDNVVFWIEETLEIPLTDKVETITPVIEPGKLVLYLN